ncbi:hypothetical protein [Paenibacillus qinlingensis]|uniref:hypothetical protein n=1 Tax=Paenibacillus qinlingensis TaxID=1837343 RepID=UPI0015662B88|nr:hypothetical protein [Paenibacillus qinlingensis]NQX63552.1 hypothetical protein [Paenibacillus qinlingensis]
MNVGEKISGVTSAFLESNNPFEEFLQIIKYDVKTAEISQNRRRRNSLQLLLDRGIIKNGDRIVLLPVNKPSDHYHSELISKATLLLGNGKPKVQWDYDNKEYSISRLTHIILVEIAQQTNLVNHHLNGTQYWVLQGTVDSLFSLANNIDKLNKTC